MKEARTHAGAELILESEGNAELGFQPPSPACMRNGRLLEYSDRWRRRRGTPRGCERGNAIGKPLLITTSSSTGLDVVFVVVRVLNLGLRQSGLQQAWDD